VYYLPHFVANAFETVAALASREKDWFMFSRESPEFS
jgi:hypothetical protein